MDFRLFSALFNGEEARRGGLLRGARLAWGDRFSCLLYSRAPRIPQLPTSPEIVRFIFFFCLSSVFVPVSRFFLALQLRPVAAADTRAKSLVARGLAEGHVEVMEMLVKC